MAGGVVRECGPMSLVAIRADGRRAHCSSLQQCFLWLTDE
jgi:hypothetical protein